MEKRMRKLSAVVLASVVATQALAQGTCPATLPNEFKIELIRLGTDQVVDLGQTVTRSYGDIGVNGQNIGRFYENPTLMIPEGTYTGTLRYSSDHQFVLSSCGEVAMTGDFLIEVQGVKDAKGKPRTNILFHPGMLPSHSTGCVLFGGRKRSADQKSFLPLGPDSPLVRLRKEFYGTDNPVACPNKIITIKINHAG